MHWHTPNAHCRHRVGQHERLDRISQIFLVQRGKDRSRQRRLDFVAIFIGSRDICAQGRKLS